MSFRSSLCKAHSPSLRAFIGPAVLLMFFRSFLLSFIYNADDISFEDTIQKKEGKGVDSSSRDSQNYDCPAASYWSFRPELDRIQPDPTTIMSKLEKLLETIRPNHIQDFVRHLGNLTIDEERNQTYNQAKEDKRMMVKKWFARHVTNGSLIYEPSCGVGLNLYMLAEIMQEEVDPYLTDIYVYGNGHDIINVARATVLWDYAPPASSLPSLTPGGFRRGKFCAGDSLKLRAFVPSNLFDLVYSGRIEPLVDPLDLVLKENMHHSEVSNYYESWCKGKYREARTLKRIAQNRQHLWFARSISEMIRIAKPGGGIVLDQVSNLDCTGEYQAGVSASFFSVSSINKYYWDVDPASLEVMEVNGAGDMNVSRVYMRKNS